MDPVALRSEKVAGTPDIFISYRRQEASYLAAWLHDTLSHRFGQASVFLDIDCIRPGVDYLDEIDEAMRQCSVLLVIMGQHWLQDPDGRRRIDEPDDPIRWEIELALTRGLTVIPVLLDEAVMPAVIDLPASISRLSRINAMSLRRHGAGADMRSLLDAVARLLVVGTQGADRGPPEEIHDPGQWATDSVRRDVKQNEGQLQDQRYRLLSQLTHFFRERVEQSVDDDTGARLTLELEMSGARTFRAGDQFLGVPDGGNRALASGTTLLDVFDHARGLLGDGLLVLGGPGSGKTTMLFELASVLAARAQSDSLHPVPIYLALQSWSERRQVLTEWAAAEMNKLYLVPMSLARLWLENGEIMLILDGLDEIPNPSVRRQCAEEINRFSRFGRPVRVPTIVASRTVEYDSIGLALQLQTAVELRRLDPISVLEDLTRAGGAAQAVADLVRADPTLLDLLSSPLLVTMLRLSVSGEGGQTSEPVWSGPVTPALLVDSYLDRRLLLERQRNRERRNAYRPETTRRHLEMLAIELSKNQETVFLPDRLDAELLPSNAPARSITVVGPLLWSVVLGLSAVVAFALAARWDIAAGFGFLSTMFAYCAMGLIAGLVSSKRVYVRLLVWLTFGMTLGIFGGLLQSPVAPILDVVNQGIQLAIFFGLMGELAVRLVGGRRALVGSISFSWAAARHYAPRSCLIGVLFAVLYNVPNWLDSGWPVIEAVLLGAFFGLILGLFVGVSLGFGRGVQLTPIPIRVHPNAELRAATRIGAITGLIATAVGGGVFFISGLFGGLDIAVIRAVAWGPGVGVLWGLAAGLGGVLQYWVVRVLLWRHGRAPLRLLGWLEYAVQLRLLYRAGGGYVFIHKTVQDALAQHRSAGPSAGS